MRDKTFIHTVNEMLESTRFYSFVQDNTNIDYSLQRRDAV
jgi:hypothetical protein